MGRVKDLFLERKYAAKKRRELGYTIDRMAQYRSNVAQLNAARDNFNLRRKNHPEQFYIVDYECNETNEVRDQNLNRNLQREAF